MKLKKCICMSKKLFLFLLTIFICCCLCACDDVVSVISGKRTVSLEQEKRVYDARGELFATCHSYYDGRGNRIRYIMTDVQNGGSQDYIFEYDSFGNCTSVSIYSANSQEPLMISYEYTYDSDGNIIGVVMSQTAIDQMGDVEPMIWNCSYDKYGMIISESASQNGEYIYYCTISGDGNNRKGFLYYYMMDSAVEMDLLYNDEGKLLKVDYQGETLMENMYMDGLLVEIRQGDEYSSYIGTYDEAGNLVRMDYYSGPNELEMSIEAVYTTMELDTMDAQRIEANANDWMGDISYALVPMETFSMKALKGLF